MKQYNLCKIIKYIQKRNYAYLAHAYQLKNLLHHNFTGESA